MTVLQPIHYGEVLHPGNTHVHLFFALVTCCLLPFDHPEDDKITSENKSNGIRPPASDFLKTEPGKPRTPAAPKEELSAEDVKKIEAKKDEEVSVKGKVSEVFVPNTGSIAILNFGKDRKKCFKAVIFKSDFEKWEGGSDAIKKKYQGKTVTVEGKVAMREGLPQIVVKTPSQLKVN